MNHEVAMFLSHLPLDTPVYKYDDFPNLENLPSRSSTEDTFVVIKNITAESLEDFGQRLKQRANFAPSLELLILMSPSLPHELASRRFDFLFMDLGRQMNLQARIHQCGSAGFKRPDREKQADASYKPKHAGRLGPSIVVETAYSQATRRLQKDIMWWLNDPCRNVRQGITIDIQSHHTIVIRSWIPALNPAAEEYRSGGNLVRMPSSPINDQTVILKRNKDTGERTIDGPRLVIPFSSMFRDELPNENKGEGDFVFTAEFLLDELAQIIWDELDDEMA